MIEIKDIHKRYNDLEVLKGISVSIDKGEVISIIGPSGTGKSTFLRCINYLEVAEQGTISFGNETYNLNNMSKKEVNQLRSHVSESLRGAILAVDKGQIEAAKSIGLSNFLMMKNIVIPQAIPVAVPSLVNTLIDTIKGSSLAFSIGVVDITAMAQIQAGLTYQYFEAYMALVLLYWIVILLLEFFQKKYEKKLKKG